MQMERENFNNVAAHFIVHDVRHLTFNGFLYFIFAKAASAGNNHQQQ
jgi:hypothetical protein